MELQEIADRIAINDLLIDYCTAVDSRDFDAFSEIFTEDAVIDYSAMGGLRGTRDEIRDYLARVMPNFPHAQHMIGNSRVWIDGDHARARTMCHNPMSMPTGDGNYQVAFYGVWYNDKLIRTAEGWRICERIEEYGYDFNVPDSFRAFSE